MASGMHSLAYDAAAEREPLNLSPQRKTLQQVINNFWRGSSSRITFIINQNLVSVFFGAFNEIFLSSLVSIFKTISINNQWKQLLLIIRMLKEQRE